MNRSFWYYLFFIASIVLAIAATLNPFTFVVPEQVSPLLIFKQFRHSSSVKDYWRNILLFLPFGISLAAILPTTKFKYITTLIISIIASCSLSLFVETLQFFLPIRVSNFSDVVTNTIGGFAGTCLYWWRSSIGSFIVAIITRNRNKLTLKSLITAFVGYFLAICLASYILLINVNLSNWNENFQLIIGNEATGDRPWQGYIKNFQISDRALSASEIERVFLENKIPTEKVNISYTFDRQKKSYISSTITAEKLVWQKNNSSNKNTSTSLKNNAVFVGGERWLVSQNPVSNLTNKLRSSDRFTLSAIVATNNLQQIGPARIISVSENIFRRNLTIGQERSHLSFRMRSPLTGENGSQPELIIPRVFSNTDFHHLLITFEKNRLDFYLDRLDNKYSFFFQPEINFLAYYPFTILGWKINVENFNLIKYYLAFCAIAFIPLGIIGGFILSLIGKNTIIKLLAIMIFCFIPPLFLELLYTAIASQPIRELNLLLGVEILSIIVLVISKR
ncbi:VanZ family protein [Myxosarcina sp. GI1]|uniref:VanZ family protein n=1 Tax=Myxosarcina sp. GI1 TaxID=1541065 RepID=UPI00056AE89E|nr:VanZ family protein [Myxosarcina sp. GI1]